MIKILVISAKMGGGKTTLAETISALSKQQGYDKVHILKFAEPLYTLHEYILNRMERYTKKPRVTKDGVLLQLLGTEWGRYVFGESVWVDILKNLISDIEYTSKPDSKELVIIDDCRFENEFDSLRDALRVRLECSEKERKARASVWRPNSLHLSETQLDKYSEQLKFDRYFNTGEGNDSPDFIAMALLDDLEKGIWHKFRNKE